MLLLAVASLLAGVGQLGPVLALSLAQLIELGRNTLLGRTKIRDRLLGEAELAVGLLLGLAASLGELFAVAFGESGQIGLVSLAFAGEGLVVLVVLAIKGRLVIGTTRSQQVIEFGTALGHRATVDRLDRFDLLAELSAGIVERPVGGIALVGELTEVADAFGFELTPQGADFGFEGFGLGLEIADAVLVVAREPLDLGGGDAGFFAGFGELSFEITELAFEVSLDIAERLGVLKHEVVDAGLVARLQIL